MQIKLKPGKPTEPGNYICKRAGSRMFELVRVFPVTWEDNEILMLGSCLIGGTLRLDHIEDDTLFSERVNLVIEE